MAARYNLPMSVFSSPPLPPRAIGWLSDLGVETPEQLASLGPVTAFLQLKSAGHTVTERLLFALAAAASGRHWNELEQREKDSLLAAARSHSPVRLPPPQDEIHRFMCVARAQAELAKEQGEVPVGAIVVHNGLIVGRGFNQPIGSHDPSAHAEMLALREASAALGNYRLAGCDLYVTLEPCAMCAGAILHARLDRVIFGAPDEKTGAAGSVIDLFGQRKLNAHTAVFGAIEAEACAAQLSEFFRERRRFKEAE